MAYFKNGDTDLAQTAFNRAVAAGSNVSRLWQGQMAYRAKDFTKAVTALTGSYLLHEPSRMNAIATLKNALASTPQTTDRALLNSVRLREAVLKGTSFGDYMASAASTSCPAAYTTLQNEVKLAEALEQPVSDMTASLATAPVDCPDGFSGYQSATYSLLNSSGVLVSSLYDVNRIYESE